MLPSRRARLDPGRRRRPRADARLRLPRPLLIGGALTSAALSLAGAYVVAGVAGGASGDPRSGVRRRRSQMAGRSPAGAAE